MSPSSVPADPQALEVLTAGGTSTSVTQKRSGVRKFQLNLRELPKDIGGLLVRNGFQCYSDS